MQAKSVSRYDTPRYPTRLEVISDPDLLKRHLPPQWRACAEMAGVVSFLLVANTGIHAGQSPASHATGKPALVAPIFEHGEGRGATGCIVVNSPVFLSEQDAMQVITEELRKHGVTLSETKVTLNEVTLPQSEQRWVMAKGVMSTEDAPTGLAKLLVLNGLDPKKRVAVEFVEGDNYYDLGGGKSGAASKNETSKGLRAK